MAHKDAPTVSQKLLLKNLCQKYGVEYPNPEFMSRGAVGAYIRKIQDKYIPNCNKKLITIIKVYNDGSTVIEHLK